MKCSFKDCDAGEEKDRKGLCSKHYAEANKLIKAGKTSWEELERMGLCRPPVSDFEAEFLRKKNEPTE